MCDQAIVKDKGVGRRNGKKGEGENIKPPDAKKGERPKRGRQVMKDFARGNSEKGGYWGKEVSRGNLGILTTGD